MKKCAGFVNKLQEALLNIGWEPIQLPQIVLVGDQGCGKSSVLEVLVGETILPSNCRSTRRPLILHLVSSSQDLGETEPWVEFVHRPNKVFFSIDEVRDEIEAETERLAGCNKGICTIPILMKVHSSKVISMTLIDLPGLTKVPVGDQPPDIEVTIKEHIMKYVKHQNSIVLAVVAANTDIETSEILKLAREADPLGIRTLCVLTKLDLMDAGTDATQVLLGRVVNVKMGIIGVINRSQRDFDNGVTISNSLKKESNFLSHNYKEIANKHGSRHLSQRLHEVLVKSLKSSLPEVQERIQNTLDGHNAKLRSLGNNFDGSQEGLLFFLTKFVSAYSDSVEGTCKNVGTKELEGGARIGYIFQEIFIKALQCLDPLEGLDRAAIFTAVRNSSGAKPSLFIPDQCFEQLVKQQILRLSQPCICCVMLVQEELVRVAFNCDNDIASKMQRFPKLRCKVYQAVNRLVKSRLPATIEMVENLVQMHSAYINTANPDFLEDTHKYRLHFNFSGLKDEEPTMDSLPKYVVTSQDTPQEVSLVMNSFPKECFLIECMIISYFNVIRKTMADAVPKTIMHFLVNYISDHLLAELVAAIYSEGDPAYLLEEEPKVAAQRDHVMKLVESLSHTQSIINDFIDAAAFYSKCTYSQK